MQADQFHEALNHDPFVPFRIVLSSGTHYDIRNPQLVMPLKREVFIAFDDGERWTLVPYIHVAALESLGRNGARKRKPRK